MQLKMYMYDSQLCRKQAVQQLKKITDVESDGKENRSTTKMALHGLVTLKVANGNATAWC